MQPPKLNSTNLSPPARLSFLNSNSYDEVLFHLSRYSDDYNTWSNVKYRDEYHALQSSSTHDCYADGRSPYPPGRTGSSDLRLTPLDQTYSNPSTTRINHMQLNDCSH